MCAVALGRRAAGRQKPAAHRVVESLADAYVAHEEIELRLLRPLGQRLRCSRRFAGFLGPDWVVLFQRFLVGEQGGLPIVREVAVQGLCGWGRKRTVPFCSLLPAETGVEN